MYLVPVSPMGRWFSIWMVLLLRGLQAVTGSLLALLASDGYSPVMLLDILAYNVPTLELKLGETVIFSLLIMY